MNRAVGRTGYNSLDGANTPIEVLNIGYSFGQVYIGAGAFTEAINSPAIFIPAAQVGSGEADSEDRWSFTNVAKSEIYARWSFAKLPIDLANPSFKIYPEFKQTAVVAKPNPAESAVFEYGIGVNADGNDSEYQMIDTSAESEVEAELVSFAVGTSAATKSVAPATISGDGLPLINTVKNNIRFAVARIPLDASDDFDDPVLFTGMIVQFKTDFNNVAEWEV